VENEKVKHIFAVDDNGNIIVDDPCNLGHNYAQCVVCKEVFDVCCDYNDEYIEREDCEGEYKSNEEV